MWPWWRLKEGDSGVYKVLLFAGYNDDPADKKHVPIVILKSLRGHLNEAVPISDIGLHFDQASTEEAALDDLETVKEFVDRVHREEEENAGS